MNPHARTFDPRALGQERLHRAAARGDLAAVKSLLPDTSGMISNYKSTILVPLVAETAILNNQLSVLEWCISHPQNLQLPRTRCLDNPFYLAACEARSAGVWKLLKEKGMDLPHQLLSSSRDPLSLGRDFTCLDVAAAEGDARLFEALLALGFAPSNADFGALAERAVVGPASLASAGADEEVTAQKRSVLVLKILRSRGPGNFRLEPPSTSLPAAGRGNFEALVYLVAELDMEPNLPLFRACWAGEYVCAEVLLDLGADPNFVPPEREDAHRAPGMVSCLTVAKLNGHFSVVDLLLDRGAVDRVCPADEDYGVETSAVGQVSQTIGMAV